MSTTAEHAKMRPVLDWAAHYDITKSSDPKALYEPLHSGFNLWCTPRDHPDDTGWSEIAPTMIKGAFMQPCEFVGTLSWGWEDVQGENGKTEHKISYLELDTDAIAVRELDSFRFPKCKNRPCDVTWATAKIEFLFRLANVEMPPIVLSDEVQRRQNMEKEAKAQSEQALENTLEGMFAKADSSEPLPPPQERMYRGFFDQEGMPRVTVNNRPLPTIKRSTGDSIAWGYAGSGPAVLARSLLADFFGERPTQKDMDWGRVRCQTLMQEFKREFLVELEQHQDWVILGSEIQAWYEALPPEDRKTRIEDDLFYDESETDPSLSRVYKAALDPNGIPVFLVGDEPMQMVKRFDEVGFNWLATDPREKKKSILNIAVSILSDFFSFQARPVDKIWIEANASVFVADVLEGLVEYSRWVVLGATIHEWLESQPPQV